MARVCVTCGRRVAGDLPVCLACGSDVGAQAGAFASLLPLNLVVTGLNLAVLVVIRFDPARLLDLAVYVTATLAAIGASRLLADA